MPERPKMVQKAWGYEELVVNNKLYCGKLLHVNPTGWGCSIHYHLQKTETFRVLSGPGLRLETWVCQPELWRPEFEYDVGSPVREVLMLYPGDAVTLVTNTLHRFSVDPRHGVGVTFIEFSTHDAPEDSLRVVPAKLLDQDTVLWSKEIEPWNRHLM